MKLNISATLLILMSGLSSISMGQNKADIIKDIRKEYQRINSLSSFQIIELDAEDFLEATPDGGAGLKAYYKKDSILKITEWLGLSYGNRSREYYFKNNQVFFVFETFDSFVETKDGLDHTKTKNSFQGRYYFNNNKLIHKLVSGNKPLDDQPVNSILPDAQNKFKLFSNRRK